MWNLVVFAVVGLLAGGTARILYPGRQPSRILGTLGLGALGGLIGGVISWDNWSEVDGQFQTGNLVVSVIGALAAIAIGAGVSYWRAIRGYRNPAQ